MRDLDAEDLEVWLLRWRYDTDTNEHQMTAYELAKHIMSCGWRREPPP